MLRNYFLIAVRNLGREKAFSFINITGLAVGIACFLTLFLFIQDELSFDKFNTSQEGPVYRLFVKSYINGVDVINSKTAGELGPVLQQEFPEVITFTRIGYYGPKAFLHDEKTFRAGNIYAADSTFFRIFNLEFLEGNPATALTKPNTLVITETAAKRIFGNENPVGKLLPTESGTNFLVTALVKDFPRNSHFRCDYLESIYTYEVNPKWLNLWYSTYIVLRAGTDAGAFEKKLEKVVIDKVGPEAQALLGVPMEQFLQSGNAYGFFLQPFSSIYLYSHRVYQIDPNTEWGSITTSDIAYIYMFGAIAFFILLLAVINFMNLATAKSERRAREVGVRKTFGSQRFNLIIQFIGEAVLMSLLAMVLALGLLTIALPLFNQLVERNLKLVLISEYYTYPLLAGFVLLVGLLAGSYPAFYLSSFRPASVLKGNDGGESRKSLLRSGLVVLQFAISISLLIGTLVIKKQIDYLQNKNLGFNKEHLVSITNANVLGNHIEAFRNELLKNPKITSLTLVSRLFGTGVPGTGYLYNKKSGTDPVPCQVADVDYDFLKTFQVGLKSGRFFSRDFPTDDDAVVVNEAAAKAFMAADPLNKELVSLDVNDTGKGYKIIGIVNDFNYESLHSQVRPLVMHLRAPRQPASSLTVRIAADDMRNTISFIEKTWQASAGEGEAINYNFVDQNLARLYVAEEKTNLVSMVFSGLAIFIACIGLYGLAAFVTEQRTREIGIRKVLGATPTQIVGLLSREFATWVVISNLIAWPVAYFVMKEWLGNFAFRIHLSVGFFAVAGTLTLVIAFITVGVHAWKAAAINPAKSLKHE